MAPNPKLTAGQVETIRALKAADPSITNQALAERYGVARTTIEKALPSAANPISSLKELPLESLSPSLHNPRRTFAADALAELAESIAQSGLLQNLVVRANSVGAYEIIAGERRFRALTLLASQSRWSALVPCRVIEANDGTSRALALLENLQRVDVAPLEEAEAFAALNALDPAIWTTDEIARRIGRSVRYVQQRLAVARNLAFPARALLSAGIITYDAARHLAAETFEIQMETLSNFGVDEVTDDDLTDFVEIPTIDITQILQEVKILAQRSAIKKPVTRAPENFEDFFDDPPGDGLQESQNEAARAAEALEHIESRINRELPDKEPAGSPVSKTHIYHGDTEMIQDPAVNSVPSGSLKLTQHALPWLVTRVLKTHRTQHGADAILLLAEALEELAAEQKLSGLTIAAPQTSVQAKRLRDYVTAPGKPLGDFDGTMTP